MNERRPLFVPLKAQWFDLFAMGTKSWEHRIARRQWNGDQVQVGRRVTLSRGYGKHARLHGVITSVKLRTFDELTEELRADIGASPSDSFISFKIQLDPETT